MEICQGSADRSGAARPVPQRREAGVGDRRLDHIRPRAQRRIQRSARIRRSGAKFPVNCELPHIGAPKNMRALCRQAQRDAEEMQMRMGIAIAVVVAIGLIWSIAVMSEWIPVVSAG